MNNNKIAQIFENKTFYTGIIIFLTLIVIVNFWVFARFIVDDAFITWRYGKNLVNHGIWNYNPSSYDMTQGYTNPIYAFLSIIPTYFHIDMVFFFKIISIITALLFCLWYARKFRNGIIVLLFAFSLPQTMIHVFSGIETFLFVALLTMLIISIYEDAHCCIIISSSLLLYTRPEALTLLFAIPLLYCNWQSIEYKNFLKINTYKPRVILRFIRNFITIKSVLFFLLLLICLLPNIIISFLNFGSILPNTFFVKNSSFTLGSIIKLTYYGLALLPLLMIFHSIPVRKMIPILVIFIPIIIQYSKTNFAMNYNLRSVYHILFPIALFVFSLIGKININHIYKINDTETGLNISLRKTSVYSLITIALILLFLSRDRTSSLLQTVNYYYRCLSAHAYSGKIINNIKDKYDIKSIACGDAGMLAFAADIDSLDLLELGSSSLRHNGIRETYQLYRPDVIFLYGDEYQARTGGIMKEVKDISQYPYIGKIAWRQDYYLWVYSNQDLPELSKAFQKSYKVNTKEEREMIADHILFPPWEQWHE